MKKIERIIVVSMLVLLACAGIVTAASVDPVLILGNPNCDEYNYIGFKIDNDAYDVPPFAGTYYFDSEHFVTLTTSVICTGDDCEEAEENSLDWISNFPVDAVIVKGGPNANMYVYEPASMGDAGLTPPINERTGFPFGLSHIEFCYALPAPEFPAGFISLIGIVGLIGLLLVAFQRK